MIFRLYKISRNNALTLLPMLVGTHRISYQELRKKREAHKKKQSEIEYVRLHFTAIVDPQKPCLWTWPYAEAQHM